MKKRKWLALLLVVPLLLTSCSDIFELGFLTEKDPGDEYEEYFDGISPMRGEIKVETQDFSNLNFEYSERDLSTDYDGGSAARIVFSDSGSTVYGKGAETDGKNVLIDAAGTYIISGRAKGARLTVTAADEDAVHLVLAGVSLEGEEGTAFDLRSAASVLLTLVGTNSLSDSTEYKPSALDRQTSAVILSRVDLSINGAGSLSIVGNRSHGVVSLGELVLTGGKLNVHTAKAGLIGEHCVKIGGGEAVIAVEEEGILSGNVLSEDDLLGYETPETDSSGYVYISGGALDITSMGDAIRSEGLLLIRDGFLELTTGVRIDDIQEEDEVETLPDFWEVFAPAETESAANNEKSFTVFSDGLHAASDILIYGGTFAINASNHALFSEKTIMVDGGRFLIKSVHGGLSAEGDVGISDGILILETARTGVEGKRVDISGGHIYIGETTRGVVTSGALSLSGGLLAVAGAKNLPLDFGVAIVTGGVLIALGNAEKAREFFPSESQRVILCSFAKQNDGYPLALCDNDGKVLLSLEGKGEYSMAYLSMPDLKRGRAYTLMSGGFAVGTDRYGFAMNTDEMIAAEPLTVVTAIS